MVDSRKAMVIGAGDLGSRVLQGLASGGSGRELRLVGRNAEATLRAANLAALSSLQTGHRNVVSEAVSDLFDVDRTAETISEFQPDVIFLTASLQSWWVISTLPQPAFQRLYRANFGPWLPMHLIPVMYAMRAVRAAGSDAVVVNAAFPDAVHPALAAAGLSPHVGIGNVANNVPGIQSSAADLLGVDVHRIDVRFIAHHYVSHRLSRTGDSGAADMILRLLLDGADVTDRLDLAELLGALPGRYRRTGGRDGQVMTAASALSVLAPLLDNLEAVVHAPGPLGRIGGYPVSLSPSGIKVVLPDGVTEAQADAANRSGQRCDGITEITADGTVRFEPEPAGVLAEELGYHCTQMRLDEAEDCAREIGERFAAYRERVLTDPGYQTRPRLAVTV
ncbi:hypothetical protein [Micromonospora sp. NPDC049645]|uniref:hypothetical protein n=1 Tax=Micromonospora sp. NPDC049645 TaxID=3155508 RepID=UPI00341DA7A3